MLLQWHITERCNLRCAHCYQQAPAAAELPLPELLGILHQFNQLLDSIAPNARGHVTVTGGEPFLRPDFLDLLEALASEKPRIGFAILTNGAFIDAPMAHRLRKLGPRFVQVSVEGAQATHDSIRGAGDFDRTVAAIRHLVREHVPTFISFTAHCLNYREFPEVARLARRLHATRVWADRLIPVGRGAAFHFLTPAQTREFIALMRSARDRFAGGWFRRTEVPLHRALQFLETGGQPYHCTAGDTLLAIQANGDLYPCRRMPIRAGNVLETPLAELYRENPLLRALRDPARSRQGCENCRFAAQCRGGLRCLAYAVTGDPFHARSRLLARRLQRDPHILTRPSAASSHRALGEEKSRRYCDFALAAFASPDSLC
ncbi:MAG: radical SAM protein [Bryobacteraceae bacterium]